PELFCTGALYVVTEEFEDLLLAAAFWAAALSAASLRLRSSSAFFAIAARRDCSAAIFFSRFLLTPIASACSFSKVDFSLARRFCSASRSAFKPACSFFLL